MTEEPSKKNKAKLGDTVMLFDLRVGEVIAVDKNWIKIEVDFSQSPSGYELSPIWTTRTDVYSILVESEEPSEWDVL